MNTFIVEGKLKVLDVGKIVVESKDGVWFSDPYNIVAKLYDRLTHEKGYNPEIDQYHFFDGAYPTIDSCIITKYHSPSESMILENLDDVRVYLNPQQEKRVSDIVRLGAVCGKKVRGKVGYSECSMFYNIQEETAIMVFTYNNLEKGGGPSSGYVVTETGEIYRGNIYLRNDDTITIG